VSREVNISDMYLLSKRTLLHGVSTLSLENVFIRDWRFFHGGKAAGV